MFIIIATQYPNPFLKLINVCFIYRFVPTHPIYLIPTTGNISTFIQENTNFIFSFFSIIQQMFNTKLVQKQCRQNHCPVQANLVLFPSNQKGSAMLAEKSQIKKRAFLTLILFFLLEDVFLWYNAADIYVPQEYLFTLLSLIFLGQYNYY